jgi:threonine dehydratase
MTETVSLPGFDDVSAAAERVRGYVRETPVLTHGAIDAAAGAQVFVKAECLQVTGSFKMRGASNRLAQISPEGRKAGVVAFSSGNHAQGRGAGGPVDGHARGDRDAVRCAEGEDRRG